MITRVCLAAALVGTAVLMADTISPSTYSGMISVGGITTIHKTVTVTPTSTAPVDVMFLTDTTGSMGGAISSVGSGFSGIVSAIAPLASNVAWGVGAYKDAGDVFVYSRNLDLTTNTANVTTALGGLSADGGGDYAEANLYALQQAATTTSWRDGSQRFLLWTGDAPGHDPSYMGVTEAGATSALTGAGIKTFAISVGYGGLDDSGQATRITAATGGELLSGNYSEAASIIQAALTSSIINYSLVNLGVVPPSGLGITITPTSGFSGTYDRTTSRTFDFDVMITGLSPGTYTFGINALVDGGVVATESDTITVGGAAVPEPATWALIGMGLGALAIVRRRRQ